MAIPANLWYGVSLLSKRVAAQGYLWILIFSTTEQGPIWWRCLEVFATAHNQNRELFWQVWTFLLDKFGQSRKARGYAGFKGWYSWKSPWLSHFQGICTLDKFGHGQSRRNGCGTRVWWQFEICEISISLHRLFKLFAESLRRSYGLHWAACLSRGSTLAPFRGLDSLGFEISKKAGAVQQMKIWTGKKDVFSLSGLHKNYPAWPVNIFIHTLFMVWKVPIYRKFP